MGKTKAKKLYNNHMAFEAEDYLFDAITKLANDYDCSKSQAIRFILKSHLSQCGRIDVKARKVVE